MKRNGFTLIELMVVIAIISLLLAILLPSLSRAKDLAKRAVCGVNIRNIWVGNQGYAMENNGFYVPASDIGGANLNRWHGVRENTNAVFDSDKGPLQSFVGDGKGITRCPDFTGASQSGGQTDAFEAGCGGYGYNATYIGGRNDLHGFNGYTQSANSGTTPAKTVMFTDTAYMAGSADGYHLIEYSFSEPPFFQMAAGPPSSWRPNPTIHFRHLNTTSVVWADGHVSWELLSFSAEYQTHSRISAERAEAEGLGWFGPESNAMFDQK